MMARRRERRQRSDAKTPPVITATRIRPRCSADCNDRPSWVRSWTSRRTRRGSAAPPRQDVERVAIECLHELLDGAPLLLEDRLPLAQTKLRVGSLRLRKSEDREDDAAHGSYEEYGEEPWIEYRHIDGLHRCDALTTQPTGDSRAADSGAICPLRESARSAAIASPRIRRRPPLTRPYAARGDRAETE